MPLKPSRRDSQKSQNSPDSENLGTALKQLCTDLKKGKNKRGQDDTPEVVKNIQSILKSYREKSQKVHNDVLSILVVAMDDGGGVEFCSQLEPAVFCIVLDTMLQADVCLNNKPQRGISYLSASLYRDSTHEDADDTIKSRKAYIGKECLGRLFKFFSDMETTDPNFMRRWVGVLTMELLRGSDENAKLVLMCSDDDRRGIARVALKDSDEHVQIIAGEVIKALAENVDLEDLWPLDEREYYTDFPLISSSRSGWTKSFSRWLESVYMEREGLAPVPTGESFELSSIELRPEANFGAPNHMAVLYLETDTLAILTPASDGHMIHILDACLSCFKFADVLPHDSPGLVEVQVTLKVDENSSTQTCIDSIALNMDKIILVMHVETWQRLHKAIADLCPGMEITPSDPDDELDLIGTTETALLEVLRHDTIGSTQMASVEVLRHEAHNLENVLDGYDSDNPKVLVMRTASVEIMQKDSLASGLRIHSTGQKLEIAIEEVEMKVQGLAQQQATVQPESRESLLELGEADKDELNKTMPSKSSGQPVIHSKGAEAISEMKMKSRNDVKHQAKPAITQISRPKTGNPDKKPPSKAISSVQNSHKQLKQVKNGNTADDVEEASNQAAVQNQNTIKPSVQASKSRVKVVGKTPLTRQGPGLKSATKVTRTPNNKQKTSTPKYMFASHVDEDDDITSPEVSTPKLKHQQSKSRTPQNLVARTDQAPQKKRYSLNVVRQMPAPDFSAADPYAFPKDDIGVEKKKTASKTPKQQTKPTPKPITSTGRTVKGNSPKAPIKPKAKRQSAPAALNEPTSSVRGNQRAAAILAKQKIHDLDDSDQEFEERIEAEIPVKATTKSKKNELMKGNPPRAKIVDMLDGSSPINTDSKSKVENMTGNVKGESTIDFKKELIVKDIIKSDIQEVNKASMKSAIGLINLPSEEKNAFDELQKSDASAVPQDDFNIFDNDLNKDFEPEPPLQPLTETIPAREPTKPAKKPTSNPAENFADKLGDLLGDISKPEIDDAANSKVLTTMMTSAKLLFGEDPLPNTSPFPPSSNLMGQDSPRLVIQEVSGQDSGAKNAISRSKELPPRALQQMKDNQTASSPPDREKPSTQATPQVLHKDAPKVKAKVLPDDFNKHDITIKAVLVNRGARENIESIKSHAKLTSLDAETLDKPMQISMDSNVLGNAGEQASSSTSHTDVNLQRPVHFKQAQNKRKATADLSPESKRIRVGIERDPQTKNIDITPQVKLRSELPRGSSDLPAHFHNVNNHGAIKSASKDPARKPNLIAFDGIQGAMNQGHSSTKKTSPEKSASLEGVERKRKRDSRTAIDTLSHSPPKKRQHSSPFEYEEFVDVADDDFLIADDPPVKSDSLAAPSDRHRSRSSRQSSQLSRVDKNGSPIAVARTDHIRKLKMILSQSDHPKSPHDQQSDSAADSLSEAEGDMFAPRAQLSPKKKIRPFPQDEEVTSRYIAHEKTGQGQYRGIKSLEVVAADSVSEDPFREPTDKHTPFAVRLAESKPTEVGKTQALASNQAHLLGHIQVRQASPILPAKERRGNQRSDHIVTRNGSKAKVFGDQEKKFVNSHRQHGRQRSPGEMTNGSSPESRSSGLGEDRVPLAEKWNMAIRPHFTTVHDAIHRIADEVIIRLVDEEGRMDLVVKQYDENGTAVLEKLFGKRESEKNAIIQGLESKSMEMKNVYTKAREHIQDQAHKLKEHPVSDFEKGWKRRQSEIQKMIIDGVESLET